jgi:hypothetical protein
MSNDLLWSENKVRDRLVEYIGEFDDADNKLTDEQMDVTVWHCELRLLLKQTRLYQYF